MNSAVKNYKKSKGKREFFGTDGVRDVANRGAMTPEMALRLGRAYILFLMERGVSQPRIVLGRDTRRSGLMLEGALSAGMDSAGAEVISLGVIPTPGVSYAVKHLKADGGAVISASHNPAEYNGIKFLDCRGCKLSDEAELSIEAYLDAPADAQRPVGDGIGSVNFMPGIVQSYAGHLASLLNEDCKKNLLNFSPEKIAFDCAHGAISAVIPAFLESAGIAGCPVIGASPDGMNINAGVGVMHMDHLGNYIKNFGCRLGFAFDGDADRVLIADLRGRVLDGDIILWILARWLARRNLLGSGVVVTVMSNMALEGHLAREGIQVFRCPVGDRYVLDTMRQQGARLGGEQSGHIIADAFTSTGDGLCTAVLFLNALQELGEDAGALTERFGRWPQKLTNLTLKSRDLPGMEQVHKIAEEAQSRIGRRGRVFIRPSGTEPLLRILVEAEDEALVGDMTDLLINQLKELPLFGGQAL